MDERNLLTDIAAAVNAETNRQNEQKGVIRSGHEGYALILQAVEAAESSAKGLKDIIKELWIGVKSKDEEVVNAYLSELQRLGRENAMAWVCLAAVASRSVLDE